MKISDNDTCALMARARGSACRALDKSGMDSALPIPQDTKKIESSSSIATTSIDNILLSSSAAAASLGIGKKIFLWKQLSW